MNNKTCIVLCFVIIFLLVVIAVGVKMLYYGIGTAVAAETVGDIVQNESVKPEDVPVVKQSAVVPAGTETAVQQSGEKTAVVIKKPEAPARTSFKVKNCKTNKMNTLRQNKDNTLELLDQTGKSQWRIMLDDRICGSVGQVDYYNNGKIQFLLAEGRNLHLIDRLGREVEGFPKILPFKAVHGPSAVNKNGELYWRIDTDGVPVYVNNKATNILTELK